MKRAFVGLSTPLCYDYGNPIRQRSESEADIPNPILENTMGLLICYDEIWFLSREACPLALHDIEYVKFVTDDPELLIRAQTARSQYDELYREWCRSPEYWQRFDLPEIDTRNQNEPSVYVSAVESLRKSVKFDLAPDNHGRGALGMGMGNADERNLITDIGVAAALDMQLEVIMNSFTAAHSISDIPSTLDRGALEQWRIEAAEHITTVKTIDFLGPKGAYHESVELLRSHPRVAEFRQYLSLLERPANDLAALAKEVENLALKHARDSLEKYLGGTGKIHTVGAAAIGTAGNLIHPGLGSALGGTLSAIQWIRDRKTRNQMAWSLFVVDARTHLGQRR
ncbi:MULTISPECIES: hypothetical protein [unclassified Streptomyces]|uniref:hypothetical protein n=1 Tax=unclassified Streptomyces TaxID=2593676 RepID=UPI000DC3FF7F|nr:MULTISPECIES: hypothetical protein [unclassified Streptomyces]MYT70370.1 hypothetical protein [Streptomyces sp. SID8367]RAJ70558.1 translation initiation factor 6 (aeIF-6) [Streptomyces sp. PsTaAH-137]